MREAIEEGFERWGRFVVRRRWAVIAATLVFSSLFIAQLPRLTIETSTEGFLHPTDPTLLAFNEFRDQFERDDRLLVAIRTDEIFDLDFLSRLRDFHAALEEEVPHVDEVDSLINARSTRGAGDELIVEDLFEEWPEDPDALAAIRRIALANPLLQDLVLSRDLRFTVVSIKLATYSQADAAADVLDFSEPEPDPRRQANGRVYMTGEENTEALAAVREVARRFAADDFELHFSGSPVFTERIGQGVSTDMRRFLALSFVTAGLFLFLLFRRVAGTLLPLIVVLLSLLTTMGAFPLLGIQLQIITQILPAFLMAVGVGDGVHILAIYYQRRRAGASPEAAIPAALKHSGLAVVMTSATTAGALASFAAAEIAPIAHMGWFAPLGVTLALAYTLSLLPALLAVFPDRAKEVERRPPLAFLDGTLQAVGAACVRRPWPVIAAWAVLIAAGGVGAARLSFSHDPMNWFPESDPIRTDTELINQELRGAMTMEVLFDTETENGLHEPRLLSELDEIERLNRGVEVNDVFVGKSISIVDILKEIHRALNENRDAYYAVPDDRMLVAQELLLFENSGSDDLEDVVDSLFSRGRMTLKIPWVDAIAYPDFIDHIDAAYREVLGPGVDVAVTGRVALLGRTFAALIETMARSYLIAFALITPLMVMLLASLKWGLLSMIPNLAPIVIAMGVMGFVGIPLDGFTMLIASIAIGLAVDDTIHFLHNFRRAHARGASVAAAVQETLRTTGQALLFTTLVLCASFFVFMFGQMVATVNFGFLTGLALAIAFLADVTLLPAILQVAGGEPGS